MEMTQISGVSDQQASDRIVGVVIYFPFDCRLVKCRHTCNAETSFAYPVTMLHTMLIGKLIRPNFLASTKTKTPCLTV